ncbi:hypothetical protein EJ05DRAFT_511396 [Pseudovirgaria hyperparasitica]|uniref:Carbohydrate esterase family 16 protein n=1 Tax=Pseudovirgaria hyperparasitica TaxID=470096 RepID=A0A6A6W942_9PEZI|nr:uncharacterized protein EJ05DRAFT_511396 [Pseudovirgaria hyperparasitica]KAF2757611.1 hypothetical protein EJ05DRAFT_511396 [Pseudovirgaria hyperparasitica]
MLHSMLQIAAVFALAISTTRGQAPSRYLFIFGDSYTTTGFDARAKPQPSLDNPLGNPSSPDLTLTGGANWVDFVIYDSSMPGIVAYNYAVGGSYVNHTAAQPQGPANKTADPDFISQENTFETTLSPHVGWTSTNSIFINYFGIVDVSTQVYKGRNVSCAESMLFPADIDSYFRLLEKQYSRGARKFITVLVPPIHRAPVFNYGDTAGNGPSVEQVTSSWNSAMKKGNSKFQNAHRDAKAQIVDPTDTFNTILNDPTKYGAPNATCYSVSGNPCLWVDFIHPGHELNQAFGKQMKDVIKEMLPPV